MTRVRRLFAAAVLAPVLLAGCTDWAGYDLDYFWNTMPVLATMRTSVAFDPYDMPRLPAEHSVPMSSPYGDLPSPFTQAQLDSAAATLINPFAGAPSPELLGRGEALFANQCAVCHGPTGGGNGPVIGAGKFPFALPVNTGAAVGRSDGYLYGVIAVGRGLMPPYGEKLNHSDRWAVVAYMRELQQAGGAAAAPAEVAPAPAPGATAPVDTAPGPAAPPADAAPGVEP